MKQKVKNIVLDELIKLINTIENDFGIEFTKKREEFFLSELDEKMTGHMVFFNIFESKISSVIESCARKISALNPNCEPIFINKSTNLLFDKNLWKDILPKDIDFNEFKNIYKSAINELNLNKRINNMISDYIN